MPNERNTGLVHQLGRVYHLITRRANVCTSPSEHTAWLLPCRQDDSRMWPCCSCSNPYGLCLAVLSHPEKVHRPLLSTVYRVPFR